MTLETWRTRALSAEAERDVLAENLDDLVFSPYLGGDAKVFDEGTAIERLLAEEVLFVGGGMQVRVLCNDLFAWGGADAEALEWGDIRAVWDAYAEHGGKGVSRWCCLHRRQPPQAPIERKWRESGFWDDALEALGGKS